MTLDELQQSLKRRSIAPLYAVIGSDDAAGRQALASLREAVCPGDVQGWNYQEVDGEQTPGSTVLALARTSSLLGDRKLIVVRSFDAMPAAEQEVLLDGLPAPDNVVVLVAAGLDKRTKAGQAVVKKCTVVDVAEPKPDQLAPWVTYLARQHGLTIKREAAQALVDISGSHTGFLAQEMEKFATYLGGKGEVTMALVEALAASGEAEAGQFAAFRLADAIAEGRSAAALSELDDLLAAGEPALRILGMIAWHYRRLLTVKAWEGEGESALIKVLGAKPFAVQKLMSQARRQTLDTLYESFTALLQADMALKTGGQDQGSLKMLVVQLCRIAQKAQVARRAM